MGYRSVLHGLNMIMQLVPRYRDTYRPVKALFLSFENIQLGFFTPILPAWPIAPFLCHPQASSRLPALQGVHQASLPRIWGTKGGNSAASSCSWHLCREQLPVICSCLHTYSRATVYTLFSPVDSLQRFLGSHLFYPRTCLKIHHSIPKDLGT